MKKIISLILAVFIASSLLTGCGEQKDNGGDKDLQQASEGDFAKVVDKFKEAFLPMDNDGYIYSEAIEAVCDYVDGEKSFQEASDTLTQAYEILEKADSEFEEQTLEEELHDVFMEYDIMPEEFEIFINFRIQDLSSYVENLSTLYYYFQSSEVSELSKNNLKFVSSIYRLMQENNRSYYFYMNINYWFVNRSQDEVNYLLEELEKDLKWCSVSPDDYAWENDREIVENKAMQYLDIYEEYLNLYAEYLGMAETDSDSMEDIFNKLDELEEKYIDM